MLIKAVMPTYNQAEFIRSALESAYILFDDMVVVDDGCTDDTDQQILAAGTPYGLTYLCHEENRGTAEAINTGIAHLEKDGVGPDIWWTWISSDNTHMRAWRACFERAIRSRVPGSVGVVYSAFIYASLHGKEHKLGEEYEANKLLNQEDCYFGPSFMIRSDVWQAVGGHRGKISHDYDHWLRVEEKCWEMGLEIVYIDEPLVRYLAHPERATCLRRHEYDVPKWREEGWKRRNQ